MKTVNSTTTYTCDFCSTTPVVSQALPSGWVEFKGVKNISFGNKTQLVPRCYYLCSTCAASTSTTVLTAIKTAATGI